VSELPGDLPAPVADGAADHLPGGIIPSMMLPATNGTMVDLSKLTGRIIVYCFPKMGRSADEPDPDGWAAIPGAYGCTQQSCRFRDHYQELKALGVSEVFGLSLQTTDYQREARDRVHLPCELLSDAEQDFTHQLQLPTFKVEGEIFHKRLTMVLSNGRVEHVFYPVFPPDEHAEEVVEWLKIHPAD
jgi:peroxiredoxin